MDTLILPAEFRAQVLVETDHGPRRLSEIYDDWQRSDFEALDESWMRVAGIGSGGYQGAWLERPRGHSKTSDFAVQVAWALAFAPRMLEGVAAAGDKDQAKNLRNGVYRLIRLNPWLEKFLKCEEWKITGRKTRSVLDIITADAPSSYGINPHFIIADELTTWRRRELWDSLDSSAAKKSDSLTIVISNAGFMDSWQWEQRELIRVDADWYFHALPGVQASWITEQKLEKQKKRRPPAVFRRLWLNEWSDGAGDALESSDVTAAMTLTAPPFGESGLPPERGWIYLAGGDLGVRRDASAVVVIGVHVGHLETRESEPFRHPNSTIQALIETGQMEAPTCEDEEIWHPGSGRIKLAAVRIWKPPVGGKVQLAEVEAGIRALHAQYNLTMIGIDPYQAEQMIQSLAADGVPAESVNQVNDTLQGMATATLDAFQNRRIDLFNHPDLLADLRALRVKEKQYGFRLESARRTSDDESGTRHADSATALCIGLFLAGKSSTARIGDKLIRGGGPLAYVPTHEHSESTVHPSHPLYRMLAQPSNN